MLVLARRGINELRDDLWTNISIMIYKYPEAEVFKGVVG